MEVLKKLYVFSTLGQMSMGKNIGKGHSNNYIHSIKSSDTIYRVQNIGIFQEILKWAQGLDSQSSGAPW